MKKTSTRRESKEVKYFIRNHSTLNFIWNVQKKQLSMLQVDKEYT